MLKKKKTTASGKLVLVKRVRRTRSHRMKFCVQRGLGALPSTSKRRGMASTHKDNNEIPLRAKEVLPGMVGGHKKVISYFLRNGVASVTPFPVSAVLPRG